MSLRVVASIVLCAIGFIAFPRPCAACSCEMMTADEAYARYDVVFRGTVTEIETRSAGERATRVITFRANVIWKGPMTQEVKVVDLSPGSTCSVNFTQGRVYTIYGMGTVSFLQHGGICAPSAAPKHEGLSVSHDTSPESTATDAVDPGSGGFWYPLIWIAFGTVLLSGVVAVVIRRAR
jgi:hypothetical protein